MVRVIPHQHRLPLLCIGCGYDLRGLPAHGNCPECGGEVWNSRNGGRLEYLDATSLMRIVWGQWLLCSGLTLLLVLSVIAVANVVWLILIYRNWPPPVLFDMAFALWVLAINICLAGVATGAALVAWPEPRERECDADRFNVRRLVSQWGFAICVLVFLLFELRIVPWSMRGWALPMVALLIPFWFVCASLLMQRMAEIARRLAFENVGEQLGDLLDGYSKMFRYVAYSVVALECVLMLLFVLPGYFAGAIAAATTAAVVALVIPLIILTLGAMFAMHNLRRELRSNWLRARRSHRASCDNS